MIPEKQFCILINIQLSTILDTMTLVYTDISAIDPVRSQHIDSFLTFIIHVYMYTIHVHVYIQACRIKMSVLGRVYLGFVSHQYFLLRNFCILYKIK